MLSALLCALAIMSLGGCGYLKNVRDDFRDCFILSAGVTPPVATAKGETYVGSFIPPSIGVYCEATDFLHLGILRKVSADLQWDRRGQGIVIDDRAKYGLLFWRNLSINQIPLRVNDYEQEGNELDAWRAYMRSAKDFILHEPAKELIYRDYMTDWTSTRMQRGWQGWEVFQLEVAIPEPFILHTGFNFRVGLDASEFFDFVVSLFGLDLYGDRAYDFRGKPRSFPSVQAVSSDRASEDSGSKPSGNPMAGAPQYLQPR